MSGGEIKMPETAPLGFEDTLHRVDQFADILILHALRLCVEIIFAVSDGTV